MADGKRTIDRLTAWSPVLLLAALAALTYWLDAQIEPPPPRRDGSTRHDPDLIVERFRAVALGPEGKPLQSIAAQRAEHFPDDNTMELTSPDIVLTQPDQPKFDVSADRARMTGDRENVYFTGHVKAVRDVEPAREGKDAVGPVVVTSEYLHVVPRTHRVTTDRPVTIEEPRGIIRGTGLELDNETKTARLRSNVSGTMEPQAAPK